MNMTQNNWNDTPLLRAGTHVINTNVKTAAPASPCAGLSIPRYNVGNIHEIKKIWGDIQKI